MRKGVLIAQLGRVFILMAIILSVINIYYWKNTFVDAISIILAAISLLIVLFYARKLSEVTNGMLVLNEAMMQVQLLNIVYKNVLEYDFESLPLSAEEEVKDKLPMITIEQLLKTYDYILKIPKEIKVYMFKDIKITNSQLKSEDHVKSLIRNKYPWMDDESLNLTFNYFF